MATAKVVALAALLCGGALSLAAAGDVRRCDAADGSCASAQSQCALYLAPSSLPHAGLGLYSGRPLPVDASLSDDDGGGGGWTDLFVPLGDPFYKALPHRGQQRFPSWLGYVWPEEPQALAELPDTFVFSFPAVPSRLWDFDTGLNDADGIEFYADDLNDAMYERFPDFEPSQKVSAFVPGVASLANHGPDGAANVDRVYESSRADYGGQEAPWHPGAGAFTPHHGIEFAAVEDVEEGEELLINYGDYWNWNNNIKLQHLAEKEEEDAKKADAGEDVSEVLNKKGFVEGIHKKWEALVKYEHYEQMEFELPTEKAKREGLAEGIARDSSEIHHGEKPYSEYRVNDFHPWNEEEDAEHNFDEEEDGSEYPYESVGTTKTIPWLDRNGACLSSGKLRVGKSSIQYAGRGVFADALISRGEVVLPSPLIAMREEDFTIYKTDENQKIARNIVDKSTIIGTELLINYAFTHPDSPLFLVPTAPLANFINHGGAATNAKGANVEIRWPMAGSNSARLFEWAYTQKHKSHFDNDFETYSFGSNHNAWLGDHPVDVLERSNKFALEYVALRDIRPGEEILIDYGKLWHEAWLEFEGRHPYARSGYFRHALGVPDGFFPKNWLGVSDRYEIAEIQDLENKPLEPGVAVPLTWAHNGKPVGSKYAYVVGLEKGFSDRFLEYSDKNGVIELYRRLLSEQEGYHLASDAFDVYKPGTLVNNTEADKQMEFFAHRYKSSKYRFNMHFVAAWNELARKDVLKALGDAGFDIAVKGFGERFGYDNMTCFHASYMGMTHCDKSLMHSDIYATNDKSWNIVFPLITIEGTEPELDIMSEDVNTIVGVNYLKDVAYAMGDFGFHKTRMVAYYDPDDDTMDHGDLAANGIPIRVVFGAYCSQIDETNVAVIRHVYDGDDPAPFADQFVDVPMREIHWDRTGTSTLAKPGGKGFETLD